MKFLFVPDSFKGTFTSAEVSEMLTEAAKSVFDSPQCYKLKMADGGEGTMEAIIDAVDGENVYVDVLGPLRENVNASYCIFNQDEAFIEMAQASGLTLINKSLRNPLKTSTYGTGQLIMNAVDRGCRHIYISIGGSATNDGGMGCLRALGVRFYDNYSQELEGMGDDLIKVARIDTSNLDHRIADIKFTVLCDVDNPLCGERGATHVFAKQKGASDENIISLEAGMCNYCNLLEETFHVNPNSIAGTGAAGGLGAALFLFLNAERKSGIEEVCKLINFQELLKSADIVITGEGRVDEQSCHGKVLMGVGEYCKKYNKYLFAIVGDKGQGWEQIFNFEINKVFAVTDKFSYNEIIRDPKGSFMTVATEMFKAIKGLV